MLFRTPTNTTTKSSDQNQQASKPVAQNTTRSYLTRPVLQALLEKLFPGHTEFNIEVCKRSALYQTCLASKWMLTAIVADR